MSDWNAAQYVAFGSERTQPAVDLACRIPLASAKRVIDLGCGPGNSTAVLAARFPEANVTGVDSSADMLAAARVSCPGCTFVSRDIETQLDGLGGGWDVVFSSACLQWIPNHATLIPQLLSMLRPGGVLAVQLPDQANQTVHQLVAKLAQTPQWQPFFGQPRQWNNLPFLQYHDILAQHTQQFDLWATTYYHHMEHCEDILQWYQGTGLRPYFNALPQEKHAAFEAAILKALRTTFVKRDNGTIIFPFPRLFFLATTPTTVDTGHS